jgi:hypothetical protein
VSFDAQDRLLMQSLLVFSDRLRDLSGAEWPSVRSSFIEPLIRVEDSEDDETLHAALDDLVGAVVVSPAMTLGRSLLARTQYGSIHWQGRRVVTFADPTAHMIRRAFFTEPIRYMVTGDELRETANVLRRGLETVHQPRFELTTLLGEANLEKISTDAEPVVTVPAEEPTPPSGPRYLNTGIFRVGEAEPMTGSESPPPGRYELGANVGSFWGPGTPGVSFPDQLLEQEFEEDTLVCQLSVDSTTAQLESTFAPLPVPRTGDGPLVRLPVVFPAPGRHALDAHLFYKGHLLQSRRLDVTVGESAQPAGEPSAPRQDGYVTFTRAHALEPDTAQRLAASPRRLTILADRDPNAENIVMRFFRVGGAEYDELAQSPTTLTTGSLKTAVDLVRTELGATMLAYSGGIGGQVEVLEERLGRLAYVGRSFYRALVPEDLQLREPDGRSDGGPEPGSIIQVDPLSPQLGVPWEVLYEREVEKYRKGRTRLCPTFAQHGPAAEDCPSSGDAKVVCPYGFWGYRYIVEQLPARVERGQPARPLEELVRNGGGLHLSAFVSTQLASVPTHLGNLEGLAPSPPLDLVRIDSFTGAEEALKGEGGCASDVLYFFTHGGRDEFGEPCLAVGADDMLTYVDLDAWKIQLARNPLVVLNACETAAYSPDDFENLIRFFVQRGAAGVVATQCDIKEQLADAMIVPFFASFFSRVPAGQAMFAARLGLLRKNDPRGLAYSLFASADVILEQALAA